MIIGLSNFVLSGTCDRTNGENIIEYDIVDINSNQTSLSGCDD